MDLFELKQADIHDVLELISSGSLTITANNAKRVAQLQIVFAGAKPSDELAKCKARCEALEHEVQECLRVRDNALLEAGVLKRRIDETQGDDAMCAACNHPKEQHAHAFGPCDHALCVCSSFVTTADQPSQ